MGTRQERRGDLNTYKVAEVGERQGVVWLSCTHGRDAHEILAELRKIFPQ